MALYFSSTFEPLLEYVHQSNHLLLNLFNHWLIRQVEHWTEAITQFFDGLGAWGAKQLISIAGRDCAIEWRAVIQRVISMGKPMGKPLRPYSGIVWLKKLNIEMWDECEMIAVYLRISFHTWSTYCIVNSQHQHDINMFFLTEASNRFQFLKYQYCCCCCCCSPVECDLRRGPTNPTTSLQLLPGTAQVGRAQTAQIRSTHQSLGKRVCIAIFSIPMLCLNRIWKDY